MTGLVLSLKSFITWKQTIFASNCDEIAFEMAACAKRNVLTANQKKLIKLHDKKVKQTEIAKLYGVKHSLLYYSSLWASRRYWKFASKWSTQVSEWQGAACIMRDLKKSRATPLSELTSRFNKCRLRTVSRHTVQRVLFKSGYHRRVVRKKIRIRHHNNRWRVAWCRNKIYLPITGYWERIIFSDESKVWVGLESRVYNWRKVGEEWQPACSAHSPPPRKKFVVTFWGCRVQNF